MFGYIYFLFCAIIGKGRHIIILVHHFPLFFQHSFFPFSLQVVRVGLEVGFKVLGWFNTTP